MAQRDGVGGSGVICPALGESLRGAGRAGRGRRGKPEEHIDKTPSQSQGKLPLPAQFSRVECAGKDRLNGK